MPSQTNVAVNAIRFVAALLVVLRHVRILMFQDYSDVQHGIIPAVVYLTTSLGDGAVLVFFCLSGYWVGGAALAKRLDNRFSVKDYAVARMTRLWVVLFPALALTLVVDLAGARLFPHADIYKHPEQYVGAYENLDHSLTTVLGNAFFIQDLHVKTLGYNHPLWSLSYEFWYYVMFAALLATTVAGASLRFRLTAAAVALAGAAIAGPSVLSAFPIWLLGAAAAFLAPAATRWVARSTPRRVANVRGLALALVLLMMIVARYYVERDPGVGVRLVASCIFGSIAAFHLWTIAPGVTWPGLRGRLMSGCSWLAESSFSLYVTHMPLVVLMTAILVPDIDDRWRLVGPAYLVMVLLAAVLVAFSVLFAHYTEKRTEGVRKWVYTWIPGREQRLGAS